MRAALDLDGKDLVVREANALLPGNGKLRVSGHIARDDPARPRFRGGRESSRRLCCGRRCAGWIRRCRVGCRRGCWRDCRRAWRSAQNCPRMLWPTADDVALQRLSGTLDDAEISGGLRLKRGDPPSLTVDLSADRLALDPWLPPRPATLAECVQGGVRLACRSAAQGPTGNVDRYHHRQLGD